MEIQKLKWEKSLVRLRLFWNYFSFNYVRLGVFIISKFDKKIIYDVILLCEINNDNNNNDDSKYYHKIAILLNTV